MSVFRKHGRFETEFIYQLTDGTTTIDFVHGDSGLFVDTLDGWRPRTPGYKGGGVFQDSPLADGRRLSDRKFTNIIERIPLILSVNNPDAGIRHMQDLRRLLEKAADYWENDWQDTPVYLVAKGVDETNTRYALVIMGVIPEDGYPYGNPWTSTLFGRKRHVQQKLNLIIEHDIWQSTIPGTGTAVAISALEAFDGRNLGNVDSSGVRDPKSTNEVFIGNHQSTANLTDIYVFDDSLGTFSGNLLDTAVPHALFPVAPASATNDICYFGVDNSLSKMGMSSLIFDIGTAAAAGTSYVITWEYWDGGAWSTLTVQDNTSSFSLTGVNSVAWIPPSDWADNIINGVDCMWVRARLSSLVGAFTSPTQQNRNIYATQWGYTEIQSTAVLGDIVAAIQAKVFNQSSDVSGTPAATDLHTNRIIIGLRSISRGSNFNAYFNASDEQNIPSLTVTLSTTSGTLVYVTTTAAPTGRLVRFTPISNSVGTTSFAIGSQVAQDFYGRFHIYLRFSSAHSGVSAVVTVKASGDTVVYTSPSVATSAATSGASIIDMGIANIGGGILISSDVNSGLTIDVALTETASTPVIDFLDMILMPIDEWAIETSDPQIASGDTSSTSYLSGNDQLLDIDSIVNLKRDIRTLHRDSPNEDLLDIWSNVANNFAMVQANSHQRLWVLSTAYDYGSPNVEFSSPFVLLSIQIIAVQRYLSMRADR